MAKKRKSTKKAGNAARLKAITRTAKGIRSKRPKMKWHTALKEAGRKHRSK